MKNEDNMNFIEVAPDNQTKILVEANIYVEETLPDFIINKPDIDYSETSLFIVQDINTELRMGKDDEEDFEDDDINNDEFEDDYDEEDFEDDDDEFMDDEDFDEDFDEGNDDFEEEFAEDDLDNFDEDEEEFDDEDEDI